MKDRLDVQRKKAEKLSGQTAGKRSNLGAEMSASAKAGPRTQVAPPAAKRVAAPQGYAKGGEVRAGVHKHEMAKHKGEPLTKLAHGGKVPPHKAHHHMKHSPRRQGM